MAIRRLFIGTAAAVGIVTAVATATPSVAQPTYPPSTPVLTASSTTAQVGQTITLNGSNFQPNSIVTITSFVSGPIALGSRTGPRAPAGAGTVRARAVSAAFTGGTPGDGTDGHGHGHGHHHGCSTGRTCRVRVDPAGDFTTQFLLTRPGITTIEAHGRDSAGQPTTDTLTVRVEGTVAGHGRPGHGHGHGSLAFTGTPVLGGLAAGLVMLLAGAGLLFGARRRRRRSPTT
ncbi:MAG TPA: hypothetical protein VFX70_02420 [Mycobacteriales bacterium]|nr:hypothetical protein [Mycobacteriales bacterium]